MFRASSLGHELAIRTVITLMVSLVSYFYLHTGAWVFALPFGVALLVVLRWVLARTHEDEQT